MKIKKNTTPAHQIEPPRCKKSLTPEQATIRIADDPKKFNVELKLDGHRYLLQVRPNGSTKNYLTSRRVSVVTNHYGEAQDDLPFIRDYAFPLSWDETIFDGEIVAGKMSSDTQHEIAQGRGEFHVWDVPYLKGRSQMNYCYDYRRKQLEDLSASFPPWMKLVESRKFKNADQFEAYLKRLRDNDHEGCILKHDDDAYGENWIKVKFEETHDVIIIGYEQSTEGKYAKNGWIKSLIIGQLNPKTKKVIEVGRASGFDEALRKDFSLNKQKFLNRVIEIKVQQRLPSGKFRHPRFMRFRDDKSPEQCLLQG